MNPAATIANARADGIVLALSPDGGLIFKGPRHVTDRWMSLLRSAKPGIVAYLSRARSGVRDLDEWKAYFDERAGIIECDGGIPRGEAERLAGQGCIAEWLDRHPSRSEPGKCLACGSDGATEALVPFGLGPTTTWLHGTCWSGWYEMRTAEATMALDALGLHITKKDAE